MATDHNPQIAATPASECKEVITYDAHKKYKIPGPQDQELQRRIFRAFAYGFICAEVAGHFGMPLKQARDWLKKYKASC